MASAVRRWLVLALAAGALACWLVAADLPKLLALPCRDAQAGALLTVLAGPLVQPDAALDIDLVTLVQDRGQLLRPLAEDRDADPLNVVTRADAGVEGGPGLAGARRTQLRLCGHATNKGALDAVHDPPPAFMRRSIAGARASSASSSRRVLNLRKRFRSWSACFRL